MTNVKAILRKHRKESKKRIFAQLVNSGTITLTDEQRDKYLEEIKRIENKIGFASLLQTSILEHRLKELRALLNKTQEPQACNSCAEDHEPEDCTRGFNQKTL